jgi:hypothetical protein
MSVQTLIQIRRGTASEWSSVNPTLSAGEWGYDTVTKRYKLGDGLTAWNSLLYSSIRPSSDDLVGVSGIGISFSANSGVPVTISVTGIGSSQINNFNSSVSGLLPVKSIFAGNNISVTPSGDNGFIISSSGAGIDNNAVKDLIGSTITGVSGIDFNYNNIAKTATISLSDPTIQSTDVTDFNTAVSGLVNGIYAPLNSPTFTGTVSGISKSMVGLGNVDNTSDADKPVSSATQSALNLKASLAGATFTGSVVIPSGTGNFNTLTVNNATVSLNGHSHTSSNITDFNTSVSGLMGVKSLVGISGIGIVNSAGTHTIAITGIPSSLITDLGNIATTEVIGRTGIALTYDSVYDIMYIDATGVSFNGHTHTWSNLTDASTISTLAELAYLSGVSPGTASAGRALVLDNDKNITSINSITTTGNITVGGNLVVQGTTTTVNSTTVEIGDNIIRVNASGLNSGGMEVYTGSDTKSLVWNTSSNRWEFSGGNVYTSGNFIGSLSGNASTVTNGVYTSDTGTVTSTMIANDTIVNADINSSAAISYSKLNLSTSIVNADIATSAAIVDTKLATISTAGKVSNSATTATNANTASAIVARDSSGNFSAGTITASLSGNATSVTNGVYVTDTGTVTNTMLAGSIANVKLLNSAVTLGSTSISLGSTTYIIAGLTSISGVSAANPTALIHCLIDGGTP